MARYERLSWSKVGTAWLCGMMFYFRHLADIERTPFGASGMRGRGPHKAAEAGYRAFMKTGERMAVEHVKEIAATTCEREVRRDGVRIDGAYADVPVSQIMGVLIDESVDLAAEYHNVIAPTIDPIGVELKVELPPSRSWPFTWVGVLDIVSRSHFVRDQKTKRKAPAKDIAEPCGMYGGQLTGYDILHRAKYKRPPAGMALDIIWRTPAKKQVKSVTLETTRDTHDIDVFVNRVAATHKMIEAEIFLPAAPDAWICSTKWCEFTDQCPFFKKTERPKS